MYPFRVARAGKLKFIIFSVSVLTAVVVLLLCVVIVVVVVGGGGGGGSGGGVCVCVSSCPPAEV